MWCTNNIYPINNDSLVYHSCDILMAKVSYKSLTGCIVTACINRYTTLLLSELFISTVSYELLCMVKLWLLVSATYIHAVSCVFRKCLCISSLVHRICCYCWPVLFAISLAMLWVDGYLLSTLVPLDSLRVNMESKWALLSSLVEL